MTKLIIIDSEESKTKGNPIKFVKHYASEKGAFVDTKGEPNQWHSVYKLPFKLDQYDVFACVGYDDHPKNGNLFLGFFNDGTI